ncbi:MAG: hypothetical protein GXO39_05365 [Thermotogae bacterium]|nr:hypothetical protein [Thermotogota bacterium]
MIGVVLGVFAKGYALGSDVSRSASFAVRTPSGGYAIRAARYNSSNGEYDAALIILDSTANLMEAKTYGWSSDHEYFYGIIGRNDGYVLVGYTRSTGPGSYNVFVVRTDLSGNLLWSKVIGSVSSDIPQFAMGTSDGGILITGYTYATGGGDAFAMKLDSTGNLLWARTWGGSSLDKATGAVEVAGNYYITGFYGYSSSDLMLVSLTSTGALNWYLTYDSGSEERGYAIDSDGSSLYIAGQRGSYSSADALLMKTDLSGLPLWAKAYDFSGQEDIFYGVHLYDEVVATGTARLSSYDATLMRVDPYGNFISGVTFDYGWDEGFTVLDHPLGYVLGLGAGSYHSVILLDTTLSSPLCFSTAYFISSDPSMVQHIPGDFTFANFSVTTSTASPTVLDATPYEITICSALELGEGTCGSSLRWKVVTGGIEFYVSKPIKLKIFSAEGRKVFEGVLEGTTFLPLKPGVYLWKGGKAVVR